MVVLHVRLASGRVFSLVPRRLLLAVCAALVAVALLSAYVQMLHESVARGDRLRGDWEAAAATSRAAAGSGHVAAR